MSDRLRKDQRIMDTQGQIRARSHGHGVINDLVSGLKHAPIWLALSWEEFVTTYRRSIFGVIWVMAAFAGFVLVKILVFSAVFPTPDANYYNAYLVTGLFAWQFLSMNVTSAPLVFVSAQSWIKNDPLPLSLYVYKAIAREFYNFALTAIVVALLLGYLRVPIGPLAILTLPAIGLFLLNAVWIKLLLGTIATRYRDITHLVRTIMTPMFFLTPIFWLPEQMGELFKYLWWNPFFHFLEIFRNPLIDQSVNWSSWAFVGTVTGLGWSVALMTYAAFRQRIVFWF